MKKFSFWSAILLGVFSLPSLAGQRSYSSVHEIRKLLRHHPRLREEYLYFVAENPGVRMAEAHVRYITVVDESSGERSYSCELNTRLTLSSGHVLSDEVEVDNHCDRLFSSSF
ncbi:hypothetical protein EBQ90_12690 [bacterium]|nr:hypothetical protein [bacterium]